MSSATEASWRVLPPRMATFECFNFAVEDASGPAFAEPIHRNWNRPVKTQTLLPAASQTGETRASPHDRAYFSGTRTGAPLSFRRSTMNFAGWV